jgi:hypothetical protein
MGTGEIFHTFLLLVEIEEQEFVILDWRTVGTYLSYKVFNRIYLVTDTGIQISGHAWTCTFYSLSGKWYR